mmetsp:Transcript_30696/g.88620  ORF Transcript_30696/g.88620 Transcript_30696/m.88620 type:complete len:98 (-) Transcript_30696:221-514(-)
MSRACRRGVLPATRFFAAAEGVTADPGAEVGAEPGADDEGPAGGAEAEWPTGAPREAETPSLAALADTPLREPPGGSAAEFAKGPGAVQAPAAQMGM